MTNDLKNKGIDSIDVLNAMQIVPREMFIPKEFENQAYSDKPLPIGYNQTISQPYIVAFMTQALDPKAENNVLEIGTGSGYQAAILSKICRQVYTIEIIKALAVRTSKLFSSLLYNNIQIKIGNGYQGWLENSPFDIIIVTAAAVSIPAPLVSQLKIGGKIILPLKQGHKQILVLGTKINTNILKKEELMPVIFVPMLNE